MSRFRERPHLILVLGLLFAASLIYRDFVVDDAYISFVYSRNLANGQGLTYNGMLVEGYSNFLWALLIAPFVLFGIDPLIAARSLSLLSAIFCLLTLDKLIGEYNPGLGKVGKGISLSTVASSSTFVAWMVGGFETLFFTFLVLLFLYVETREPELAEITSPMVLLLIALTRPEGLLLLPVMVIYRIFFRGISGRKVLRSIIFFIIPFTLFLLWRYRMYGYVLPNSAYIKIHANLQTISLASEWLLQFFLLRPIFSIVLALSFIILIKERRLLDQQWSILMLMVGSFLAFILYAGRDWMPFHRFLVPVVPLFGLLIANTLSTYQNGMSRIVIMTLVISIGIFELVMSLTVYRQQITDFGRYTSGLIETGKRIKQTTRPDSTIAVVDAGALAYFSERPTIDILGMNNTQIAHHPEMDVAGYVMEFDPLIVQLHLGRLPSRVFVGSKDHEINSLILRHPEFTSCYKLASEKSEDPYLPFLFFRECD